MDVTTAPETVQPFDEIPVISLPVDYPPVFPAFLAEMALQHGPVFRRRMPESLWDRYGEWVVYLVGPEANRFVLHTERQVFSHDLGWTPNLEFVAEKGLLNTDDPEHAVQRRMMNPGFAMAYMNRYLPLMQGVIERRTRDWAERGTINLYEESRLIAFDVAAEALVGFESGDRVDRLRDLFVQILHGAPETVTESEEEFVRRVTAARADLDGTLLRLIAERRAHPGDDILGMLVSARDEDGRAFTDREILGQVHILLIAGHETTTTMNAWALYFLAQYPAWLAQVHHEIDAMPAESGAETMMKALRSARILGYAVDEAGRLRPPVAVLPRGTVTDVAFGGYHLPAGTTVRLGVAATHLLPHVFTDPTQYDPSRFAPPREEARRTPYALVTFGGGPRICIGMNFAQIEMKATAAHVLRRYSLHPVPDRPAEQLYFGLTAAVPDGIWVRVEPRKR